MTQQRTWRYMPAGINPKHGGRMLWIRQTSGISRAVVFDGCGEF